MILKSASLKDLQDFCDNQFKLAEGENAKLLSADEVKRLTETRNKANAVAKEYDELARNYQELLKDYNEMVQHTSTPERTKEIDNPAGEVRSEKFDAEKFAENWFKNASK